MKRTQSHDLIRYEGAHCEASDLKLIGEEPLLIRMEGRPYSVVMRTPGEEDFHVAGFCLAEGLVDQPEDIQTLAYCDQLGANVATVTLRPERRKAVAPLLERRGFVSQTSCGLCGKELIKDLCQDITPIEHKAGLTVHQASQCLHQLPRHQRLYVETGSSHAAMIFDTEGNVLAVSEDVGRNNAVDKAIGKVFLDRNLDNALLAVLSSRISYELVQKGARARLPILISLSRPTALSVELAQRLNMTLACTSKDGGILVFCGQDRLQGKGMSASPCTATRG